jgi:hypothetical protein
MKNNNTRRAFSTVEILVVLSAVMVTMYIAAPAAKAVGSSLYSWFATPAPTAAGKACEQAVAATTSVLDRATEALTGK